MTRWDPWDVVVAFNDCITRADLDGLTALMTEDHTFIDSAGREVTGREASVDAWRSFFAAFPGYRNEFDGPVNVTDNRVAVGGRSHCSVAELDGPAAWRATIVDGRVARWQVLAR